MKSHIKLVTTAIVLLTVACEGTGQKIAVDEATYDVIIRQGQIYDGLGHAPMIGDIAIDGDRVVALAKHIEASGAEEIDAQGLAVAPGFINLLSWSGEALIEDGRGLSALHQGITLEVMGEGVSMGPLSDSMKADLLQRQGDITYPIEWSSLGEYLEFLERKGISINVASYLGAATVRWNVLGADDVDPDPSQLADMQKLVRVAMEEGAVGVASSLIYPPGVYAETDELVTLAQEAGACGGIYATHMRSEGEQFLEAIDETLEISRRSGAPAHIFHLKVGGRNNWPKMSEALVRIEAARSSGLRVTADMYPYAASGTGLSASMPPWAQTGGHGWIAKLKEPALRAKIIAEMKDEGAPWENVMRMAGGGEHVLLVGFKNPKLKPLIGKTLAEVAAARGKGVEETLVDLVYEDDSRVNAIYFTMSEDNLDLKITRPYLSFSTDGVAMSDQGVFLKSATHPRSYGSFPRVLSRFVGDKKLLTLEEAIRRMTSQPAMILGLKDRGHIGPGYFADIIIFDPEKTKDNATFVAPHQYASGVETVLVNGRVVLRDGEATNASSGRFVRGRAWLGSADGGCRSKSTDWDWDSRL